jgi:hypothetical protein
VVYIKCGLEKVGFREPWVCCCGACGDFVNLARTVER